MDAALRKAKDSLGQIFDKNLHDLVRGIRNHKENESKYIAECIDEIKLELKQDNPQVKSNAVNKLCYLEMLGYDISWAAFNIIEVMSSAKFTHKRIGYLTASQSFHEGTDVLMLTTNMVRKDLASQNMYEAGIALSGLACFMTPDLARDLASEIMCLMTSSKPYLRKKAVLIMYKVFLKYPDALRPSFPRLKEKLDDPEASVQAAAVNVICELARKNPHNYLSLAPIFFKLMTASTNNWVLIKIIKLFGALTPLEPRLGKKLIEPLTNLINSTSAMSLLYECINTVLAVLVSISSGQPNHDSAIQICLQKLRILIEDTDQNLKYLGLLAMSKILKTDPKSVQTHKDLIMQCLDDKDESIRLRSLDLLYGMVSKKNLMEIIKKLMLHMNKAEGTHYRDELIAKIVDICSQNNYQHVTNFEWYVTVLVELTRMEGTRHGKLLAHQMLDVAIRVESIRPFIVRQMAILLDNIHVFTTSLATSVTKSLSDIYEVLYAATWICGEFARHLNDPVKTMESMLKSKVTNLPGHIQSAFVQNIFKLYSHEMTRIHEDPDESKRLTQFVLDKIQIFELSSDIEVQERACAMLQVLKYVQKMLLASQPPRVDLEIAALFDGDLNPVGAKAQRKVPVPEGLDLDSWINEPSPSDLEEDNDQNDDQSALFSNDQRPVVAQNYTSLSSSSYGGGGGQNQQQQQHSSGYGARQIAPELSQEDLSKYKESRKIQLESNPYYMKSGTSVKKSESSNLFGGQQNGAHSQYVVDPATIITETIDLKIPLAIPGVINSSESYVRMSQIDRENKKLKKKMKSKRKGDAKRRDKNNDDDDDEDDDAGGPLVKVLANEMPEGALDDSDGENKAKRAVNDPHRALDINLDDPLKDTERLYVAKHRVISPSESKLEVSKETAKETLLPKTKSPTKSKTKSSKTKKESKKSTKREHNKSVDLLLTTEATSQVLINDDYNELLSPDNESVTSSTHDSATTAKTLKLNDTTDDMDFWLSTTTTATAQTLVVEDLSEVNAEKATKSSKKSKSKSSDKDKEKSSKKDKKSKSKQVVAVNEETTAVSHSVTNGVTPNEDTNTVAYKPMASNKHLKISYLIKPNLLNQMIVKFRINNIIQSSSINDFTEIHSIELNIIDSVILKLIRSVSQTSKEQDDTILIPFNLMSNCASPKETELFFNVSDCTFPHKIKGTLTYMLKNEQTAANGNGSMHEKIDVKIEFPCSVFLTQSSCSSDDFAKFLSSGELNSKYAIKTEPTQFKDIQDAVNRLRGAFELAIVEIVDNSASLFANTIQNHPICILVKFLNDQSVAIDGKSTNTSLAQNLLEELKANLSL
jgi:AP-3 complex subunit delta-1